jgi:hypothetical protein
MDIGLSVYDRTLFVWSKGGKIRCFSPDETIRRESAMIAAGWVHTATIDPARWIESANGRMLDELRNGPLCQHALQIENLTEN